MFSFHLYWLKRSFWTNPVLHRLPALAQEVHIRQCHSRLWTTFIYPGLFENQNLSLLFGQSALQFFLPELARNSINGETSQHLRPRLPVGLVTNYKPETIRHSFLEANLPNRFCGGGDMCIVFTSVAGVQSLWSPRQRVHRHQDNQEQDPVPQPGTDWSEAAGTYESKRPRGKILHRWVSKRVTPSCLGAS